MGYSGKLNGLITNDWDRDNLMFLLTSPESVLKEWYAQADADDLLYAQELINAYRLELEMRYEDNRVESRLLKMDEFADAKSVIDRVK